MRVGRISDVPATPVGGPASSGGGITIQRLTPDSRDYRVSIVHFARGARNRLHAHDCEQVLIGLAGKGIVATETEQATLGEGDYVLIAAFEKHLHGAADDSDSTQLQVTRQDTKETVVFDQR